MTLDSNTPFQPLLATEESRPQSSFSRKRVALAGVGALLVLGVVAVFAFSGSSSASTSLASNFNYPVYALTNVKKTDSSLSGLLVLQDGTTGPYGNDIRELSFNAFFDKTYRLHVKITDAHNQRWEVPGIIVDNVSQGVRASETDYTFKYVEKPFSFSVIRKSNNEVIFDSAAGNGVNPLVFEDQYIELGTAVKPNPVIYGLGERIQSLRIDFNYKTYTMFAKDQGTPFDDGKAPGKQTYASHPFHMEIRDNGLTHGVFLLNSNAMDVYLTPKSLAYRTIGGVIDMYIFLGPNPETVIRQYHELIGTPVMMPYWMLGFHQCRWGYANTQQTEAVVDSYRQNQIPLDTMWNDIDYMDRYQDFTADPRQFPVQQMQAFIGRLHDKGMHYIPIVDAGVAIERGYFGYEEGLKRDIYIKNQYGQPLKGKVWPGPAVYPDWWNPQTTQYWGDMLSIMRNWIPFDGLWLDMNEVSNFCNGECTDSFLPNDIEHECDGAYKGVFNPDCPPYTPGGVNLKEKTVSMSAKHYNTIEYNVHNMFGFMETVATNKYLTQTLKKRPAIISRSTFPGHGRYGGHWLGDNVATWEDMHRSIAGVINFQMFGIPMVGADICGFGHDTNVELCSRWMAMGAFYPFSRNHNDKDSISQEPYALGDTVLSVSRKYLNIRYSLLPLWYTAFYQSHVTGGSVVQALSFLWPEDSVTHPIDTQFMIGNALLVSPVLTKGAQSISTYFPAGRWYNYESGAVIADANKGRWVTINTPIDYLPLHVLGGSIIPRHDVNGALTTRDARKNSFNLLVALCSQGAAQGSLFVDDGETVGTVESGDYLEVSMKVANSVLKGSIVKNGLTDFSAVSKTLNTVTVYGVSASVRSVSVVQGKSRAVDRANWKLENGVLVVSNANIDISQPFELHW